MRLLIESVFVVLFFIIFAKQIKKYSVAFYLGSYLVATLAIMHYNFYWNLNVPRYFNEYVVDTFSRGVFATVAFIIVMYLGVVTKPTKLSRRLFLIRGEMSIMASIFTFCHNIAFGVVYFKMLFIKPTAMPLSVLIASIMSIIMIVLLVPLFITSFICVRKRMNAKSWKNLQRLAYPFFILIYAHIMVLYCMNPKKYLLDIIIYTLVYAVYVILRIRKCLIKCK